MDVPNNIIELKAGSWENIDVFFIQKKEGDSPTIDKFIFATDLPAWKGQMEDEGKEVLLNL
jgi:hypothetical protein